MTAPDLTTYRAVHTALTLGARRMAATAPTLDPSDRRRARAFAAYWQGYAGEVLAHHTVEDDFVFPALAAAAPVAADLLDRAIDDHHHLDELMAAIGAAVERIAGGANDPRLTGLLRELEAHMEQHLGFEDDDLLPLIERHLSGEEYEQLEEQAMKSLGLGKQAAFTVPFIAAALDADARAHVIGGAPLPFRVLYRLTRGRHARLEALALGSAAAPHPVAAR